MNVSKLILNNFRGIEDLEIELEQGKALIISGPNGAGKSSILGAVEFFLTGKNPTGQTKQAGLLKAGTKRGAVIAVINGAEISRDVDTGKLDIEGMSAKASAKECDQKLLALANLNSAEDVARALRPDLLLQMAAKDQTAIWSNLLGLRIDSAYIDTKLIELGKAVKSEYHKLFPRVITNLATCYKAFYTERTVVKRELANTKVMLAAKEKEKEEGEAPGFVQAPDPDAKRFADAERQQIAKKLGAIEQRERDKEARAKAAEQLEELTAAIWEPVKRQSVEDRIATLNEWLSEQPKLASRRAEANKQLLKLDSTACPTCHREWDDLASRQEQIDTLTGELAELNLKLAQCDNWESTRQIGLTHLSEQNELIKAQIALAARLADSETANEEGEDKESLEAKLAEYNGLIASLEEQDNAAKAYAYWLAEYGNLKDAVAQGEERVIALEALVLLFGDSAGGLKAAALRRASADIEAQLTGVLANWDMAARLSSNLELELQRNGQWRPVYACSDGERILVALAIQTWLAEQSRTRMVLIDRLEALDLNNQAIALGAIEDLLTSKAIDFALVAGVGLDNATLKLEAKTEVAV